MGMYHELIKSCPYCGATCMEQIGDLFGGLRSFVVDDPKSLARELRAGEIEQLY